MNIGVFDSGIGGFSILKELFKLIPEANYFYVADSEFCPYGQKTSNEILERSLYISELLLKENVDIIVLACNTATAHGINNLREKFPNVQFVGVEPFLNAINIFDNAKDSDKWISLTTASTQESERFFDLKQLRDPQHRIQNIVINELVPLIEQVYEDQVMSPKLYEKLESLLSVVNKSQVDWVILGCTHYPLIKHEISTILEANVVDPSSSIAQRVKFIANSHADSCGDNENFKFMSTPELNWQTKSRIHLDLFEKK